MKRFTKFICLALAGCSMLPLGLRAQQMPPVPVDKNVRIGKLDNGLTYYILSGKPGGLLYRPKGRVHSGRRKPARIGSLLRAHVFQRHQAFPRQHVDSLAGIGRCEVRHEPQCLYSCRRDRVPHLRSAFGTHRCAGLLPADSERLGKRFVARRQSH